MFWYADAPPPFDEYGMVEYGEGVEAVGSGDNDVGTVDAVVCNVDGDGPTTTADEEVEDDAGGHGVGDVVLDLPSPK